MTLIELTRDDEELLELLKKFLTAHFKKKCHHVATVLKTRSSKTYFALHLDIQGFDVCAEPIALSNALLNKETAFELVISVIQTDQGPAVVNPCGNCRQMFLQYAPDVYVTIDIGGLLKKVKAEDLLPHPY